jgi:hypothetical protein
MTLWLEVLKLALEFLKNPPVVAAVIIISFFFLIIYVTPLGVVCWTSWESTNRLETAILKGCGINRVTTVPGRGLTTE